MDEIEIPEAIREEIQLPQKSNRTALIPVILGIVFCLGIGGILSRFILFSPAKPDSPVVQQPVQKPVGQSQAKPSPPNTSKTPPDEANTGGNSLEKPVKEDLLGHLPYETAPEASLEAITADARLKLRTNAARKFKQMQADAKADGINLAAISAFRTPETQEHLFFGIKEQRVQNAATRAEVSAPPGYSEHHTGYAVDIGDGDVPVTHLETTFAQTPAFKWLEKNALKYSFELSFPPDNELGVSYEPWHWRFVGDRHSLETFYKARN